ncbi:MAG: threonyl-tRNA synthetase editing domain-containing protein [Candidatus Poribacteria bacterium]|nr:threonyl-tRNA synthetase editing domain-containing protein [Candidatus Poribacteria bacterium]
MKLLMFYAPEFWFKTTYKVLDTVADTACDQRIRDTVVVFVHAEAEDEARAGKVLTKMVKNIKWLAGKFASKTVVLHSFSHLGMSKSSPEFAHQILIDAGNRLTNTGFTVEMTPFGYLHEFSLHVSGESLGRVFKEI